MHFLTLEVLLVALCFVSTSVVAAPDHVAARRQVKLDRAVPKPDSLDFKRRLVEKRSYAHDAENDVVVARREEVKRNQNSRRKLTEEKNLPNVKRAGPSMTYDPAYGYTSTATNYATTVSTTLSPVLSTVVSRGSTTVRTVATSTIRATYTTDTSYGVSSSRLPYPTTATYTTTITSSVPTTLFTTSTGSSVGYSTRYSTQVNCAIFGVVCATTVNSQLVPTTTSFSTSTFATATRNIPTTTTSTGTIQYTYTPGATPTGSTGGNSDDNCDSRNCPVLRPIAIREPVFGICICV